MTAVLPASVADGLAAVLRGESVSWPSLGVEPGELLAVCAKEDLTGLVHHQLGMRPDMGWPRSLRDALTREARAAATQELLRRREVVSVLDALAARGVHPILLKGAPLAYTVYEAPGLRPRADTDLLVPREETETVRSVMAAMGYTATNFSDGAFLFRQFELRKDDAYGVAHAFDIHWKVSTESIFADLLVHDELAIEAIPVPALGARARTAGAVHALLLACVHPVMHHRNAERLIWLYDIHVLAQRLSRAEFARFTALALRKGVAAICAHQLRRARARLGAPVPDEVIAALAAPGHERSASYLVLERRWKDELLSNVRGVSRWTDRVRLLREVAFPAPGYMLRAYGMGRTALAGVVLPALYLHRAARGIWRVLRDRK